MNLHFVVGTGRCGSSLVHELLAAHPAVGFISNLDDKLHAFDFKGRFNNQLYALTRGMFTRKGRLRFAPSEAYRLVAARVTSAYGHSMRDLLASDVTPWMRHAFLEFFETRWRAQSRPAFLHKYTGWSRIGFFSEIFPEARFIHVVRDGRAVANSFLQMDWWLGYRGPNHWQYGMLPDDARDEWEQSGRSFVCLAGLAWRMLIESYQAALSRLPGDKCLEVRYEDFLREPEATMHAMTDFLGLEWSARCDGALARVRFDRTRERSFERDLSRQQIVELEKGIGPVLRHYGYE